MSELCVHDTHNSDTHTHTHSLRLAVFTGFGLVHGFIFITYFHRLVLLISSAAAVLITFRVLSTFRCVKMIRQANAG